MELYYSPANDEFSIDLNGVIAFEEAQTITAKAVDDSTPMNQAMIKVLSFDWDTDDVTEYYSE
ncbi:MAG: hypothetical protein DBP02_10090 [gamma proteobacterium symbiont of Ctena orbiculata]|nr:MAG: hypothetical protein DBP01_16165 [gamma proteobacterium symbiont of Ctena orbiculata]PUB83975.1 MAG: hypothetical protein DBP02_10090 [gamma proteobacterium symbiont of Ctena orbiculata]